MKAARAKWETRSGAGQTTMMKIELGAEGRLPRVIMVQLQLLLHWSWPTGNRCILSSEVTLLLSCFYEDTNDDLVVTKFLFLVAFFSILRIVRHASFSKLYVLSF